MWTLKNELQFIICNAMQLRLILPCFIILDDEGNSPFKKMLQPVKVADKWKKNPQNPNNLSLWEA